jgi:hypothetical protein
MTYINPRRAVAGALPMALLARVARRLSDDCAATPGATLADDFAPLLDALEGAIADTLGGLGAAGAAKARQRLHRLQGEILRPFEGNTLVTVFLGCAYLWRDLLAEGRAVLVAGSPLDAAWEAMRAAICDAAGDDLLADVDRSGEKMARRLRDHLRRLGYER